MSDVSLYSLTLSDMHFLGGPISLFEAGPSLMRRAYRGTSLIRNTLLLGPCSMALPKPLAILVGGRSFLCVRYPCIPAPVWSRACYSRGGTTETPRLEETASPLRTTVGTRHGPIVPL
jgi:hypothetical protein